MADQEITLPAASPENPIAKLPPPQSDLVDGLDHSESSQVAAGDASDVRPLAIPPHQKRRGRHAVGDRIQNQIATSSSSISHLGRQYSFLVGASDPMTKVLSQIAGAARADKHVCVYGESGTGKELVARAIHYSSHRANRPLIVYDCTVIPEGLMEAELFGHVKGSFSSALVDRDGVFQLANGGSLFFNEIGELSLAFQEKLLRVIQCREFRQAGGKDPIKVDVRIVAASNRDLSDLVGMKRFRQDLLSYLENISITLPALRNRKEDIPILVDHFIQRYNHQNEKQIRGVSAKTMGLLLRYNWPGNVRELENCIWRAAVMSDSDTINLEDLSLLLRPERRRRSPIPSDENSWPRNLKDAERDFIVNTLQHLKGNRAETAKVLGISLRSLYYKLKGIEEARIPQFARRRVRIKRSSGSLLDDTNSCVELEIRKKIQGL